MTQLLIEFFPPFIFWMIFASFFASVISAVFKKKTLTRQIEILGICCCCAGVLFIAFSAKRPPLFGPFESCIYIALILALLSKKVDAKGFSIHTIVILFIMILQAGFSFAINEDYYMYDNIWVILFFNLRLLAAAWFIHVTALYLTWFFDMSNGSEVIPRQARFHLLMATFIYLCSEWTGSLWCLNWFGDSWQWSSGFLKASILFLLVMLVCHLPRTLGTKRVVNAFFGALPGCYVLWMIFYH